MVRRAGRGRGRWSSFPMSPSEARQPSSATWLDRIRASPRSSGGPGQSVERFPAVVVLHGCGGISGHSAGIADRLGSEGYVALAVDSLGSRGVASRCGGTGSPEQAFDAYSARR